MNIAIFGNSNKRATIEEVTHLLSLMRQHEDVHAFLSAELRNEMHIRDEYPLFLPESDAPVDVALSVGGDGTFLTTAMQVVARQIPVLGINCGNLGFLADVHTDDVEMVLQKLLTKDFITEQRSMLELTADKGLSIAPVALNEIAVLKQELASMITVETSLNGEPFHNYNGDGLIISTPTGSTAYNLSAGGPIAVPQSRVMLLSPVATHSLNVRPLVVPDDWQLDLRVHSRTGAFLISVDGRSQRLTDDVTLHIERSAYSLSLIRMTDDSFIHSLKTKLNWGI